MLRVSDLGSPSLGGIAVRYSPGVPAGAVGRGTWSNQPSFSSYIGNRAVFDHTSGLEVSSSRTREVKYIPLAGAEEGCSSNPRGGMIQDTLGSEPDLTSAAKSLGNVGVKALA
jgi:hypothetical protein